LQLTAADSQDLAMVLPVGYLFPASCQLPACPEIVAALLAESPASFSSLPNAPCLFAMRYALGDESGIAGACLR
jgi:hypothetical protein